MKHPIKFSTVNVTPVLFKEPGEVVMNPSIAHWKDDLFLCSYRVYIRYASLDTDMYSEDPHTNPNHPWLGGIKSTTWWQSSRGYDKTRFVLLKIRGENVSLVHSFGMTPGVDVRLFKMEYNLFIMTGNVWVRNEEISLGKNAKTCDNGCMLMIVRTISIENDRLIFSDGTILCPDRSDTIEKNWTVWKNLKGELMASYGITPNHQVFQLSVENKKDVTCSNISTIRGKSNFFKKLSSYYKKSCPAHFPWCSSTSTPAIMRKSGNYIAVGHFKYKYDSVEPVGNSHLQKFTRFLHEKGKRFHPEFVYLMFLYEFEPIKPYTILRVSNMFIPESSFSLVFASGLEFSPVDKKYIISYGDHDNECWFMFMSEDEIENALMPLPAPQDIEFLLI